MKLGKLFLLTPLIELKIVLEYYIVMDKYIK